MAAVEDFIDVGNILGKSWVGLSLSYELRGYVMVMMSHKHGKHGHEISIICFADFIFYKLLNLQTLHVYYIHFSQFTHPMGGGRPPLATGE